MQPTIGIVPTAKLFEGEDPFQDQYIFVNNYPKRILENGGIPLGVLSVDGRAAEEALGLCQGFLLCGGGKLWPYHLQVVEHAVTEGKPLLGICLGMQAVCAYFRVREEAEKRGGGETLALFETMKRERYLFNLPVPNHWDAPATRENMAAAKHPVEVVAGTYLHSLLGQSRVWGATLHRYRVNGVAQGLAVSARTADGAIEGVELGANILGVQFHPEVEREFDCLFADLINKCAARPCAGPTRAAIS